MGLNDTLMSGFSSEAWQHDSLETLDEWALPWTQLTSPALLKYRMFMFVWLCVVLAVGIPGNLLVIISVLAIQKLRKMTNLLFASLAFADLGVLAMDACMLVGIIIGRKSFEMNHFLCHFSCFLCVVGCFVSFWNITLIAFNRYLFIVHPKVFEKVFTTKGTFLMVLVVYGCAILVYLPGSVLVGGVPTFNPVALHCETDQHDRFYAVSVYLVTSFLVPMVVVLYFHLHIFLVAKRGAMKQKLSEKRRAEQRQLLLSLSVISAWYIATWLPFVLVRFTDVGNGSFEASYYTDLLAYMNSAFNWAVYVLTHTGFRRAILGKFCKSLGQSTTVSSTTGKSIPKSTVISNH